jgi:hypothetical protein
MFIKGIFVVKLNISRKAQEMIFNCAGLVDLLEASHFFLIFPPIIAE